MGARTPRRVYSIMYNLITSQPGAKDLENHKALVNDPQVINRVRQPGLLALQSVVTFGSSLLSVARLQRHLAGSEIALNSNV